MLLPLPEEPLASPTNPDDGSSDMFKNFQRFGFTYLDESGEELIFSVGTTSDDDEGHHGLNQEAEVVMPECSDAEESDALPEWAAWDSQPGDYWPYPSKTVSDKLQAPTRPKTHLPTG